MQQRRYRKSQRGFVLVATVWVLAALSVAVGFLATWTEELLDRAIAEESTILGEIDKQSTLQVVLHLLMTRPMSNYALAVGDAPFPVARMGTTASAPSAGDDDDSAATRGFVLSDGRVNPGTGSAVFALQDEAGLVHLYNRELMPALLGQLGIPYERATPMLDKLIDYSDADDFVRVDGAERSMYDLSGLAAPINRPLTTVWQVKGVLDWGGDSGLWETAALPRYTTLLPIDTLNPLAASPAVLQAVGVMDANQAGKLMKAKATGQVEMIGETVADVAPLEWYRSEIMLPTPARSVRVAVGSDKSPVIDEWRIELRTQAEFDDKPWIVKSAVSVPRGRHWMQRPAGELPAHLGKAAPLFALDGKAAAPVAGEAR